MIDPLTEVVALLQPQARYSKLVGAAGAWRVDRSEAGQPFYCVVLDGGCRLTVGEDDPVVLARGDFVLIPAARAFIMASLTGSASDDAATRPEPLADGQLRLGDQGGPPDTQLLVGHCDFGSPDSALLVTLLPRLVHVRGERRLATLVELVREESRALRPARDAVLARLMEVLFIEALRSAAGTAASPGLLRGLADDRLAVALRHMHQDMTRPWTVAQLANAAAMSRSAFFDRFNRAVGMAPMAYLLAWRMAWAKHLLSRGEGGVAEVARQVGYGSASAFSVAFARHVGLPPSRYAVGGTI
nr:AraC family transcriptional regulator [uncultured Duganella sp.]